ncbi:membrane MotB of proton-channel complex MotA/MotB family protein, partial [Vibrio parahaemolyticus V-223/04]
KPWTSLSRR